ncbi:2-keto-4-pentenoate hydratase/2-oxohepta-3-ene-1,7-dioic acid hydratase in catechol pathway [Arthrobacter ginsengisoli]|uniref:2-keto-4-pentenoate hydratase/2-oxohepta-3-ene-1,7-dioic acid hydratase in catechol pathway n=1 Tax=Arthrobacter ginsengisoli TaxID=1356565 RepID=A0ABU1UIS7_9MICC|nr:fumarylacetoacetate hydrolase family protein [Arthrobacter ginsengisoli]MDR7085089.1 2-keto-4-pentenoate hydratase/2-oxohepta-3-ene-1,7-dioic acid hydratase in catechol pathway [Arthrobacter ginsengisoli]
MNYASFTAADGSPTWGVIIDAQAYDLGPTGLNLAPTLRAAVEQGIFGALGEEFRTAPVRPEADIEFLPAITDPGKVICIGVNYRSHQNETGNAAHQKEQKAPTIFTRFADSQMGHLQPALMPATTNEFDYEGEMALVIGKQAWHVAEDEAFDYVAGYSAYNDFSVRDWQLATTQWTPGKNFPGTGGFGPYLVPAADLGDVTKLTLETRVNGDVRQKASVADLYFTIPQLIAYITGFTPLSPGDVIVTGTPGGVGRFMTPSGLLNEGDVVEVEITGLGVLRNTVVPSA